MCKINADNKNYVIFVPRSLPGEVLTARITSTHRGYARAEKIGILQQHDHATTPHCPYFLPHLDDTTQPYCGGCSFQSLLYPAQLSVKQHQVASLLHKIAKIPPERLDALLQPIVPAPLQYAFRNKMQFSVATASATREVIIGLHPPGSETDIVPLQSCSIQSDTANAVLAHIAAYFLDLNKRHGNDDEAAAVVLRLRDVVIRHSLAYDNYLVHFITQGCPAAMAAPSLQPLVDSLLENFNAGTKPTIISCVHSNDTCDSSGENERRGRGRRQKGAKSTAAAAMEEKYEEVVMHGQGYLVEKLYGLQFKISPSSFFQTNTKQAEKLVEAVLQKAELSAEDVVLDLYCGAGALSLPLAQRCRHVYGIELSEAATRDAQYNAQCNNVRNATFAAADLNKKSSIPVDVLQHVHVVVVDPARPGLSKHCIESLILFGGGGMDGMESSLRRLVYVSCNPSTQARDIALLCGSGIFELKSVQCIDMYPQTSHVETIAVLDVSSQ